MLAAVAAVVAAMLLAACGGEDEEQEAPEQPAAFSVAQLESTLQTSISRGNEEPGVPPVESVDCPDDAELVVGGGADCEVRGGDETDNVGVRIIDENRVNYAGGFGGQDEFGQGITVE